MIKVREFLLVAGIAIDRSWVNRDIVFQEAGALIIWPERLNILSNCLQRPRVIDFDYPERCDPPRSPLNSVFSNPCSFDLPPSQIATQSTTTFRVEKSRGARHSKSPSSPGLRPTQTSPPHWFAVSLHHQRSSFSRHLGRLQGASERIQSAAGELACPRKLWPLPHTAWCPLSSPDVAEWLER